MRTKKNYIFTGKLVKLIIKLPLVFIGGVISLFLPKKIIAIIPNHSIGVCIYNAENILSYISENNIQKNDVIVYTGSVEEDCNRTIMNLYSRVLKFKRKPFIYWLLNNGGIETLVLFKRAVPKFKTGIFYSAIIGKKVNIEFNNAEVDHNWELLSKIGLNRDDRLALVSVRSNLYWNKRGFKNNLTEQIRNSSFENLELSIEFLKKLNYKIIRMGEYVDDIHAAYISLNSFNKNERDMLDVFLNSIAELVICGPSGLAYIAAAFSKPTLIHNMIPIGEVPTISKSVVIPKIIFNYRTKKIIPYNDYYKYKKKVIGDDYIYPKIIEYNLLNFRDQNLFQDFTLDVCENTPEEIMLALVELIDMVDKKSLFDNKNDNLNFTRAFRKNRLMNNFGGIFSKSVLSKRELSE